MDSTSVFCPNLAGPARGYRQGQYPRVTDNAAARVTRARVHLGSRHRVRGLVAKTEGE